MTNNKAIFRIFLSILLIIGGFAIFLYGFFSNNGPAMLTGESFMYLAYYFKIKYKYKIYYRILLSLLMFIFGFIILILGFIYNISEAIALGTSMVLVTYYVKPRKKTEKTENNESNEHSEIDEV